MVLDARQLKDRYQGKWSKSNARELMVLGMLNTVLPKRFEARLTGLGAGSTEYIPESYRDLLEAFDIAIFDLETGNPVLLVEVTGADSYKELGCQDRESHLKCIGSWKLAKARRYRVSYSVWAVFITPAGRDRWQHYLWLERNLEAPYVKRCRLYNDERELLCTPPGRWVKRESFIRWFNNYWAIAAKYLEHADIAIELEKLHSQGKDPASPDPF